MLEDRLEGRVSRRNFLKLGLSLGLAALTGITLFEEAEATKRKKTKVVKSKPEPTSYAKIPVPNLEYESLHAEVNLKGVQVAEVFSEYGRIQRTLRWKNIAEAVGHRYGVDPYILLGMIAQESMGDPTLPNLSGDGGAGLIHMQPLLTSMYGLKMITHSKKLRDFKQGHKIEAAINKTNGDLKDLIAYDDRLHPIKNIDAAARMLCDLRQQTSSWDKALERYAGRGTYNNKVKAFAKKMKDKKYLRKIEADFNSRNATMHVDGKPLTFDRYLIIFHRQNDNYGLAAYRKLAQRRVKT